MSQVTDIKQLRKDGDEIIQRVKAIYDSDILEEQHQAIIKFQEGVMWLGMMLKAMNEANPYPSSKDPNTGDVIEPTADNLKL